MSNHFSGFQKQDEDSWQQKIKTDLKSDSYESILFPLNSNVKIDPASLNQHQANQLSQFPKLWKGLQFLEVIDPNNCNQLALEALQNGADGLCLYLSKPLSELELAQVFEGISIANIPICIKGPGVYDKNCLQALTKLLFQPRAKDEEQAVVSVNLLSHIAWTGEWRNSKEEDFSLLVEFMKHPEAKLLVDLGAFAEAGASQITQMALALSQLQEYVKLLGEDCLNKISVQFSTGPDFLVELSKQRAFRRLWSFFCSKYELSPRLNLNAVHNIRYETVYDDYNNLLRHCSASISASLGGADNIELVPFNRVYTSATAFSLRMARNVVSILKDESYLAQYQDPANGAYFMEELSYNMEKEAYKLFQGWEKQGGYLSCLASGAIQNLIEQEAAAEQANFNEGKLVLIGSNMHPNKEEKKAKLIEFETALMREEDGVDFRPIQARRLAEELELTRLSQEA